MNQFEIPRQVGIAEHIKRRNTADIAARAIRGEVSLNKGNLAAGKAVESGVLVPTVPVLNRSSIQRG